MDVELALAESELRRREWAAAQARVDQLVRRDPTNRRLQRGVDTIFLMSALEFGYLSSTLAKEVAQFGGDVGEMVPPPVRSALEARFRA